jgi:hypothetical protein
MAKKRSSLSHRAPIGPLLDSIVINRNYGGHMASPRRYIPLEAIPDNVWNAEQNLLSIPNSVLDFYKQQKDRYRNQEPAFSSTNGAVGGATMEETVRHFIDRFENSSGRMTYVMFDPLSAFNNICDLLHETLSAGKVAILDAPCGSGAATTTIVAILTELRARKILPTFPLTLSVIGADISDSALELFERSVLSQRDLAQKQGIELDCRTSRWDARDPASTTELVAKWLKECGGDGVEYIVLIPNFSGAAHDKDFFNDFQFSFTSMCTLLHAKKYTVIWIEQCSNKAMDKLFKHLKSLVYGALRRLVGWSLATDEKPQCADYNMLFVGQDQPKRTGVMIMRFSRD